MIKASVALDDIRSHLENRKSKLTGADFSSAKSKETYKRFHALLVWQLAIDVDTQDKVVRLYFKECLSDFATAYFLNLTGLYKASRIVARSGIENIFRVVLASKGVDVTEINSVPTLVANCKSQYPEDSLQFSIVTNLYKIYGDLCKTVHSVSIKHMSLRVPFEKIDGQVKKYHDEILSILNDIFLKSGTILYLEFHNLLLLIDYRNADAIRDSLPKAVKRAAIGGTI